MTESIATQTLILGVDPGLEGALAYFCFATKKCVAIYDMPLMDWRQKQVVDPYKLASIIEAHAKDTRLAVVEEVGSMSKSGRKQGSVGMFNFGRSAGVVHGAIASFLIPMRLATPAGWKMAMGLSGDKDLSLERARTMFPEMGAKFKRKKDNGRAEALLLAVFGARGLSSIMQKNPRANTR